LNRGLEQSLDVWWGEMRRGELGGVSESNTVLLLLLLMADG